MKLADVSVSNPTEFYFDTFMRALSPYDVNARLSCPEKSVFWEAKNACLSFEHKVILFLMLITLSELHEDFLDESSFPHKYRLIE